MKKVKLSKSRELFEANDGEYFIRDHNSTLNSYSLWTGKKVENKIIFKNELQHTISFGLSEIGIFMEASE